MIFSGTDPRDLTSCTKLAMGMVKRIFDIIIVCVAASILFGCSDDDDVGGGTSTGELILDAIVGDWTATSAMFTTTNANPVQSRDVVADGGFGDLSIHQNHTFALVIRNPGDPDPQLTTGRFVADGNFINVIFDTDPNVSIRWDFTISGDNLTIEGPMTYDFESDGTFEDVSAIMEFIPI